MIDFWFTTGSTYSYLSAMRLPEVARANGVRFRWRPFNLRTILEEMKHIPFADKPAKCAYMWVDIERRAAMYGINVKVPAPYPLKDSVFSNKVAIVGMKEGWGEEYVRAAYRRWLQLGQESGSEPNVSDSLREVGQDPVRVIDLANGAWADATLAAETAQARELGIFGSPTFVVVKELFWGDDRLEDAICWHKNGHLQKIA
jgi:2-hydroxychromene-2-carboxylate isomerase